MIDNDQNVLAMKDLVKNKITKELDSLKLVETLESFYKICLDLDPDGKFEIVCCMEAATINPVFSRSVVFSMGRSLGITQGCLSSFLDRHSENVKTILCPTPRKWMGMYLKPNQKTSKEHSVLKAREIFGDNLPLKLEQGKRADRAEALLIANYARAVEAGEILYVPSAKNIKKKTGKRKHGKGVTRKKTNKVNLEKKVIIEDI